MVGALSAVAMAAEIAVTVGSEKILVIGIVLIASESGRARDVGVLTQCEIQGTSCTGLLPWQRGLNSGEL